MCEPGDGLCFEYCHMNIAHFTVKRASGELQPCLVGVADLKSSHTEGSLCLLKKGVKEERERGRENTRLLCNC